MAQVFCTDKAFFLVLGNKKLIAWGDGSHGGELPEGAKCDMEKAGIDQVWSNAGAFVARLQNGQVIAWGSDSHGGKLPEGAKGVMETAGVDQVWSNEAAFLARLKNGQVITWGNDSYGGTLPEGAKGDMEKTGIDQVWSSSHAFVARLQNGQVIAWGSDSHGGKLPDGAKGVMETAGVDQVLSNRFAFLARLKNGQVIVWGNDSHGGKLPEGAKGVMETAGIDQVWSDQAAFLVRLKNGQVIAWGNASYGGTLPEGTKGDMEKTGIDQVWSNAGAFLARLKNGQVIVWGNSLAGGKLPEGAKDDMEKVGIDQVWSSRGAFLARLKNGQIIAWGNDSWGGKLPEGAKGDMENAGIDQVWSTESAFLACLKNGQIIAWGNDSNGGKVPEGAKGDMQKVYWAIAIEEAKRWGIGTSQDEDSMKKDAEIQSLRERNEQLQQQIDALKEAFEEFKRDVHQKDVFEIKQSLATKTEVAQIQAMRDRLERVDKKPAFFTLYKTLGEPRTPEEVLAAVKNFVEEYGRQVGAQQRDVSDFYEILKQEAEATGRPSNMSEVAWMGAKLWTCDHRLRIAVPGGTDRPLYFMLSHSNRDDGLKLLQNGGMVLQKSLNAALVNRSGNMIPQAWPPTSWNRKTYRGSGIDARELSFWTGLMALPDDQKTYRIPAPLATSVRRHVAEYFLSRVIAPLRKVLFVCRWRSGDRPCVHARFIDSVSSCAGEEEILLTGYSAVKLRSFNDNVDPIEIEIDICEDNKLEAESLPLALWH